MILDFNLARQQRTVKTCPLKGLLDFRHLPEGMQTVQQNISSLAESLHHITATFPQLPQGVAAKKRDAEQAVRAHYPVAFLKKTIQICQPLQCRCRYQQIRRSPAERQQSGIRLHERYSRAEALSGAAEHGIRQIKSAQPTLRIQPTQRIEQQTGSAADIKYRRRRSGKMALHKLYESSDHPLLDGSMPVVLRGMAVKCTGYAMGVAHCFHSHSPQNPSHRH